VTIEGWIRAHVPLEGTTSAELRYERMIWQSAEALPWVHRPADPARSFDWVDGAQIGAFLTGLDGAHRVLDIGTGDGWPGLPLARHVREVVALDPSPRRADLARDNAHRLGLTNVEVVCAPAEELPFADGSFDGVASATAIEQCGDPLAALREAFRVLCPGGRFAATLEDLSAELRSPVEETAELYIEGPRVTAAAQRTRREPVLGWRNDPEAFSRLLDFLEETSARSAPLRPTGDEPTPDVEGQVVVYRLVHRSLEPLREAEYELRFRASAALRQATEDVRPVPTFRSTPDEPGLRPVLPDDPVLGIPCLEQACEDLLSARFFELRHRSPGETMALAEAAGFTGVKAYGNIARLAREFFSPAHLEGLLLKLAPHMDEVSRAFGRLYGAVPVGRTSVFFLVARKP
jgi:SAM-dependent methyltransferase